MWGGHSAMTLFIPQVNAPQCMQWHAPLIRLNDLNSIVYLAVCVCSLIPRPSPSFPSLAVRYRILPGQCPGLPRSGTASGVPYCKRREAGRGPGNEAMCVCVCVCHPPLSIVHCSSYSVNTNPNIWHSSVYFSTWCGGTNEPSP